MNVTTVGTGATFTPGDAEVGKYLRVTASYTDVYGAEESVSSALTAAVQNVNDLPTGSVILSDDTPTVNQTLTVSNTLADDDGLGTISYLWETATDAAMTSDAKIVAVGHTYTPDSDDVGLYLRVIASYTDDHGTPEKVSSAVVMVSDLIRFSITPTTSSVTEDTSDGDLNNASYTISYTGELGEGESASVDVAHLLDKTSSADYVANVMSAITAAAAADPEITFDGTTLTFHNHRVESTTVYTPTVGTSYQSPHGGPGTVHWTNPENAVDGDSQTYASISAGPGEHSHSLLLNGLNLNLPADAILKGAQVRLVTSATTEPESSSITLSRDSLTATVTKSPLATYSSWSDGEVIAAHPHDTWGTLVHEHVNVNDPDLGIMVRITHGDVRLYSVELILHYDEPGDPPPKSLDFSIEVADDTETELPETFRFVLSNAVTSAGDAVIDSDTATTTIIDNDNRLPTGDVTIDDTTPTEDQLLTASHSLADPDGLGDITYTWESATDAAFTTDVTVVGSGAEFTPGDAEAGRYLRVTVSYTDGYGNSESVSSAVTAAVENVDDAPTGSVTIDDMTPTEDELLTAGNTLADADGLGEITYTWESATDAEFSADVTTVGTGETFVPDDAEVGRYLRVTASYVDGFGVPNSVSSSVTAPVINVDDFPTGEVLIDDMTPTENQTLTASNTLSDPDGIGEVFYQWISAADPTMLDDQRTVGTGTTFTPGEEEVGRYLAVVASYEQEGGLYSNSVMSAVTAPVENENTPPSGGVTIDDTTPNAGQLLTASHSLVDPDGPDEITEVLFVWESAIDADFTTGVVALATGETFTPGLDEIGQYLRVTAYYTDAQGTEESVSSVVTSQVDNFRDPVVFTISGDVTVTEDGNDADNNQATYTISYTGGLQPGESASVDVTAMCWARPQVRTTTRRRLRTHWSRLSPPRQASHWKVRH